MFWGFLSAAAKYSRSENPPKKLVTHEGFLVYHDVPCLLFSGSWDSLQRPPVLHRVYVVNATQV